MKKLSILAICFIFLAGVMTSCKNEGSSASGTEEAAKSGETPANGEAAKTDPATSESTLPPTTIEFDNMNHDFGKIKEGEVVTHKYKFKNTGSNPLKIENVKASCGCTTPSWTKEEVPAGGEGFIAVEFDSKGKGEGVQNKHVTVTLNTPERTLQLNFTGEIVK